MSAFVKFMILAPDLQKLYGRQDSAKGDLLRQAAQLTDDLRRCLEEAENERDPFRGV